MAINVTWIKGQYWLDSYKWTKQKENNVKNITIQERRYHWHSL